jgi:hypothetical protein
MTLLSELEASPSPRPRELAARLAGKLVPTWGFVAYGALYLLVVGLLAFTISGGVAAWALASAFGFSPAHPMPAAVEALIGLVGTCGAAVSFWPFGLWARSKRAPARRLFELGDLVDGVVESTMTVSVRGTPVTVETVGFLRNGLTIRASVSYGGPALHATGARRRLLVADGVPLVSAFGPSGAVVAGRIK